MSSVQYDIKTSDKIVTKITVKQVITLMVSIGETVHKAVHSITTKSNKI